MARYRTTVWTAQPPGPQAISRRWRSRIISAWYPNARLDVVRGNPLRINDPSTGWWVYRGDKLFGLGNPNVTTAYCDLGILTSIGDATRISALAIATPDAAYSGTRQSLFDTANSGAANGNGFSLDTGYNNKDKAFYYNVDKFVAENSVTTFTDGVRGVYGSTYNKNTNAVVTYKNGVALTSAGGFDTATNIAYGTNPFVIGGRPVSGRVSAWGGSIELVVLSPTIWAAADYQRLIGANLWAELFEPLWVRCYSLPAASSNQSIVAPLGALTLTELLPTITQGNSVLSPLGALTLTELIPAFNQTEGIVAPLGSLTLNELLPSFAQGNGLTAPLGALTLTELLPTFNQTEGIVAPLGALTLTELLPTFVQAGDQSITAPLGAIVLNELPPSFTQSTPITPIAGGGSGGGGGGKRQLEKEIRELPLFKKLEARKPGQSIQDVLSEPDEVPPPKPTKTVIPEVRKQVVEARAEVEPKKEPESPALKIINERLDEIKQELKALRARAEAEGLPINTEEDDAEILLILSALL